MIEDLCLYEFTISWKHWNWKMHFISPVFHRWLGALYWRILGTEWFQRRGFCCSVQTHTAGSVPHTVAMFLSHHWHSSDRHSALCAAGSQTAGKTAFTYFSKDHSGEPWQAAVLPAETLQGASTWVMCRKTIETGSFLKVYVSYWYKILAWGNHRLKPKHRAVIETVLPTKSFRLVLQLQ